jgi:peroxiredoxin
MTSTHVLAASAAVLTIVLALGAGCRADEATPGPSPDDLVVAENLGPAAAFTLVDLDGKTVSLADYAGRAVILDFWATWCAPCVREIPHFVQLHEDYGDAGLTIIGIPVNDTPEDVRQFVAANGVEYPILLGDESVIRAIAQAYGGVPVIPTTFFIDPDGQIARRFQGYHDMDTLESALRPILPPPPPTS